jgi:hypothetical protein
MTPAEMTAAASDMAAVLERQPQLSDFGFGVSDRSKPPAEQAAELRIERDRIREPRSLAQFMAARQWLSQFGKLKAINNRRGTSYGLKHVAEHDIGYVNQRRLHSSAISEGFTVQQANNSPNAWFNISTKAWRRP